MSIECAQEWRPPATSCHHAFRTSETAGLPLARHGRFACPNGCGCANMQPHNSMDRSTELSKSHMYSHRMAATMEKRTNVQKLRFGHAKSDGCGRGSAPTSMTSTNMVANSPRYLQDATSVAHHAQSGAHASGWSAHIWMQKATTAAQK